MKREIVMLSLMGSLMLGLWGCGSSGTALPSEPVTEVGPENASAYATEEILPEVWYTADDLLEMWDAGTLTKEDVVKMAEAGEMNDATFEEMISYIEREEEYAARIDMIRASDEGWSVYDLIDLYYAGALSKEAIAEMVAAGEISSETFEEFLARMEWGGGSTIQSEITSESEGFAKDTDMSGLLTEHIFEYADSDGYEIRETIQLSPIFTGEDMDIVYVLWEALGNDTSSFPSKQSLCDENSMLMNHELEYIIGTCMIENLTDGFPITPDQPRSYAISLTAEGNGDTATLFNNRSVSAVIYSDKMIYYSDILSVMIGDTKMVSDTWGPCTFVIALPNTHAPNQPDGYRYDEIQIAFDFNAYDPYGCPDYGPLTLEYFKKGGD